MPADAAAFSDEEWLRPVLADDVLLQQSYGDDASDSDAESEDDGAVTVASLTRELARIKETFAAYRCDSLLLCALASVVGSNILC